jgi:hypothetical protein
MLLFVASALMSLGLWLSPAHRKSFWLWSFWLNLAHLILSLGTIIAYSFMATFEGEQTPLIPSVGSILLAILALAYFFLFTFLPITRKQLFCSASAVKPEATAAEPQAK